MVPYLSTVPEQKKACHMLAMVTSLVEALMALGGSSHNNREGKTYGEKGTGWKEVFIFNLSWWNLNIIKSFLAGSTPPSSTGSWEPPPPPLDFSVAFSNPRGISQVQCAKGGGRRQMSM